MSVHMVMAYIVMAYTSSLVTEYDPERRLWVDESRRLFDTLSDNLPQDICKVIAYIGTAYKVMAGYGL